MEISVFYYSEGHVSTATAITVATPADFGTGSVDHSVDFSCLLANGTTCCFLPFSIVTELGESLWSLTWIGTSAQKDKVSKVNQNNEKQSKVR